MDKREANGRKRECQWSNQTVTERERKRQKKGRYSAREIEREGGRLKKNNRRAYGLLIEDKIIDFGF